jgi:hypothetical protein
MLKFDFPLNLSDKGYLLFSDEIENNSHVYFHGTSMESFEKIVNQGFKLINGAQSISFSRNSGLALKYACDRRDDNSPLGVVMAVMYPSNFNFFHQEDFGMHVYRTDIQPSIIGYCIIPANYLHM